MVNLTPEYGIAPVNNFSYIVDRYKNTKNLPDNCAWGIRLIDVIAHNAIFVKIYGVSLDGSNACIWINCYNYSNWTGWREL